MKVAILFLAAALGSASPVRTQNSIQARDEQKSCDCSKPFRASNVREISGCPTGYKDVSDTFLPKCVQIGCSDQDYKAQCDVKPQEAPSATEVEEPTSTQTSFDEQKPCDCSKPFRVHVQEIFGCPAGYEDVSDTFIPKCVQIGCSAQDYKAQCDVKPQEAPSATEVEEPTSTQTSFDEQKSCDCSKPFRASNVREISGCPTGYKDVSDTFLPKCVQIGCSAQDYQAQCDAKP